jgi:hypothetical protein
MQETEFIQTSSRLVSLKNVSNINVIEKENRIVFNMNYNIEIEKRGEYRLISDYVYWDLLNADDCQRALSVIKKNRYFVDNFITYENVSVNINEISSMKFSDKKLRVIFNLSHPITFNDYHGNTSITSEFVYFNFNSESEYKNANKSIKLTLLKG